MKTSLLITITSPDRPGIVERVTQAIVAGGGNWEESRMAHLGGDFAGIVKVSVPAERAASLAAALRGLADGELTVTVHEAHPSASQPPATGALYDLQLSGADHEGIVHAVSAYLAERGVNVETMETEVVPAPISATPLFRMNATISVPPRVLPAQLTADLARIADDLGVDICVDRRGS